MRLTAANTVVSPIVTHITDRYLHCRSYAILYRDIGGTHLLPTHKMSHLLSLSHDTLSPSSRFILYSSALSYTFDPSHQLRR